MPPRTKATSSADTPDLSDDPQPPKEGQASRPVADATADDTSVLNELALQSAKGITPMTGGGLDLDLDGGPDEDDIPTRELVFAYAKSSDGNEYMVARVHRDGRVRADRPSEEDEDVMEQHPVEVKEGQHFVVRHPSTGQHRVLSRSEFEDEFMGGTSLVQNSQQTALEDPFA